MPRTYFDPERADAPTDADLLDIYGERSNESLSLRHEREDFHADDGGPFESFYDWE